MNEEYHHSITVYPNGNIYGGELDEKAGMSEKLFASNAFKAKAIWNNPLSAKEKGLVARTNSNPELTGLFSRVWNDPTQSINGLMATTTIANSENLTHLQLIRLFPQAQGMPIDYFWLDNMFLKRDIPQLEFRESFHDATQTAEYLDRLEESKVTKTNYDEIKYDLRKLVDKVYTPIEDILRTIINPQTIDLSLLQWGMKRRRNQEALEEGLNKIGNPQGTIGNFADIGANYHSTNRSASELNDLFVQFLRTEDVPITHVAMNNKLFQEYTENTWTKSGPNDINAQRFSNGGVTTLPGFSDGKIAVIDSSLPDNTIFAVNKALGLRLGEGPKIMRRYRDEERDAEAIKVIDFNQYISVNDQITKINRNFGMTITVAA